MEISDSGSGFIANASNIDADNVNGANILNSFLYDIGSSNVSWTNSTVDTIKSDAIYVFDSSALKLSNFSIKNVSGGSAIYVFDSSTLDISNSSILNVQNSSAIYVFRDSSLNADNLHVENVDANWNYAVNVFDGSHLALNHSSLKNCSGYACLAFSDGDAYSATPSSIDIENSTLDGGTGSGILTYGDGNISATINHSSIQNFANYSIESYASFIIHAENNWWGNDTGPYNETKNPTGTAGSIFNPVNSDNVDFIPFCANEKCQTHNPVILIPGIMGTELLKNYDDQSEIWPNPSKLIFSITDNFLNDLALNADGTENSAKPMVLGDIIRGTDINILGYHYQSHTFDGLIDELEKNGYVEGKDLFVSSYDWRKSNADSAEKLKDKINEVLAETGADKVDLVAHSMGGLVAKKYIADNSADKIDQLIFIGTPHIGAPLAFKALMYGDDMGIRFGSSILSPSKVKYISQNMPGVYELLPSKKYVDGDDTFLGMKYIIDMVTPRPIVLLTTPYLSYEETKNFMERQGRNGKMFPFAEALHRSIDNLDLSGVKTVNFAGCGTTKTISRITTKKKKSWTLFGTKLVDDYKIDYANGDDTVPIISANRGAYDKKLFVKGYTHGELPSAKGLKEEVVSLLEGKTPGAFSNVSDDISICEIDGIVISLHSTLDPVSALPLVQPEVFDDKGNHTGPIANKNPSPGSEDVGASSQDIEYGIPGAQYDRIGGTVYLFLPSGSSYRIVNHFSGSGGNSGGGDAGESRIGGYDLNVENVAPDDTKTKEIEFNDIPVDTGEEVSQIEIPDPASSGEEEEPIPPIIQIDANGDGNFEKEIEPDVILDGAKAKDTIPPSTLGAVSGGTISLSATDDNSGVSETLYSLDDEETWIKYEEPVATDPTPGGPDIIVQYFSTDKAGNSEGIKTLTISAPPAPCRPTATPPCGGWQP